MTEMLSTGRQKAMSSGNKTKTLTSATFKVSDGAQSAIFSELAGITSEVEQVEYMEAGEKGPEFGRFIGKAKPPTVTLKRAMSTGKDTSWIWGWHSVARTASEAAYKNAELSLFSAGDPETPIKTYSLVNAFPSKVEIAGMKAGGTEVVIQSVTLMCDEIVEL